MKKRILALLLTVCMLVLSVPMFVLPAAAEEPVYSTSFNSTTNMPALDAFTKNASSVEWVGGWAFHGYNQWMKPGVDAGWGNGMLWVGPTTDADGGWATWGGHVTIGGKFISMNFANTDVENYGPIGSLQASSITDPAGKGGWAAVRYTAEKTGVANVYLDKLGNGAANSEGTFTYTLFIAGEKVKEWTITKTAGADMWIYEEKTLVAEDVAIRAGQVIEFVVECDQVSGDKAMNGGNVMFPTIEYSSTADRFSTSYSDKSNTPTQAGNKPVYYGNWTALTTKAGVATYDYNNLNPINWAGTSGNYANLATSGGNGFISWGNSNINYHGKLGTVGASNTQATIIRYTSEKSGTADIYFDLLGNVANRAVGTFTYTVYLNGTKIWPMNGETNSVTCNNENTAHVIYNQQTLVVEGITLNAGDKIDFVCEGTPGFNLWGNGGNAMFSTIEFTKVNDNVATFNDLTNVPVINEDKTVTFNGNFIPVGYEKGEDGFDYSDPDAALVMDIQTALWGAGQGIAPTAPHLAWANKAHMVIKAFNANYFNQVGQIAVTGTMSGGLRYVAEETGTVNIDFAQIGNTAPRSAGIAKFTYFVYVNGETVWESKGSEWTTSVQNNVAVATDVDLKLGDVVDFIVEGDVGAADPWGGSGNVLYPLISWTKIIPKATASVNLALATNFALNAKVDLPISVLSSVAKVGLLVNDEEVALTKTGDATYAIYNVLKAYAQDLGSAEVTLQPYYVTTDGLTIWGTKSKANLLAVLQTYVDSADKATSDLAKATLNYVAEAQKYFDPTLTADQLANAILGNKDMSYRDMIVTSNGNSAIVVDNKKATVSFSGVSMILNNAIALKLHIELPAGADIEDYKLEVVELATQDKINNNKFDKGAATATIQLKNTDEEGNAVAYVGTTFENMDKVYQFRVLDAKGNVVSDTVAYSPLAYATRMANDIEVGYVCKALIALDDAITAYVAAR